MIQLERMTWSNWFSYGKDNSIDFTESGLTQLIGANGSGKTSIPLILEETLYGKNSKGIKKQDIPNRLNPKEPLTSEIKFHVDDEEYIVKLKRQSTLKLQLFKNGKDISSHTATNTYKKLEEILVYDFKTFNQIIYQSSKANLYFLTSTDSQRKAFLVTLFNLNKYLKILDIFKDKYKKLSQQYSKAEGTCEVLRKWIDKHKVMDLKEKNSLPIPKPLLDIAKNLVKVENNLKELDNINGKIRKNNDYIKMLKALDINSLAEAIDKPDINIREDLQKQINIANHEIKDLTNIIDKWNKLSKENTCPTCSSIIDRDNIYKLISDYESEIAVYTLNRDKCKRQLILFKGMEDKYNEHKKVTLEFESLTARIDRSLDTEMLDKIQLTKQLKELKEIVSSHEFEMKKVNKHNMEVAEHNSKVKVIQGQLIEYDNALTEALENLIAVEDELTTTDILRKAFSPSGFINYKLESLVSDLQTEINNYLEEFSDGMFQLIFSIKGDKLNINISNNSNTVEINSLSSGELAKVNISTLLAIRKLMLDISKTKINLLFLDEIMGVLDQHSREKLIEMLLEEKDLNTYLVSHAYTHPLLNKLNVFKTKGISRLESG